MRSHCLNVQTENIKNSCMKRFFTLISFFMVSMAIVAVPAQRGIWRQVKLADGTVVKVELRGDEHMKYWTAEDGKCFVPEYGTNHFKAIDKEELIKASDTRRQQQQQIIKDARKKSQKRASGVQYVGKKKGLIILANYSDVTFAASHTLDLYKRIANEVGFSHALGFKQSVKDYYLTQSYGQFELDFDVIGPVQLPESQAYYGGNGSGGDDKKPGEMVAMACRLADEYVNYADYDWDGDGIVDQVFVLYAGRGEASGGSADTIWPHMWALSSSDYGKNVVLDGVTVSTYACSCENTYSRTNIITGAMEGERIDGIGTICHEFSHCLGLPDMYDTTGSNYGMGTWDLMAGGSYNGKSYTPAGYTSYERSWAGWLQPIVLDKPTTVKDVKALSDGGDAFIIYNDANPNEFYMLENRQLTGTDVSLYGAGMLVLHVDYDENIWSWNKVNSFISSYYVSNDHQRCTIFHADNENRQSYVSSIAGDPYPYVQTAADGTTQVVNNSLTNQSLPASTVYNVNTDGSNFMNKPVTNIVQNEDGTISFDFMGGSNDNIISGIEHITVKKDTEGNGKIYSIDGRYLGTDKTKLSKGLYIINGKKVIF